MSTRVLLLEDDRLLGETLEDLLDDAGYEVVHVVNGQEALDATYASKFALYLLDINVPLLDGVSLLGALRDADDATPAIFLTSHKEKEMLERGFKSGGDDYIKKPFDNDELLWRIEALLKRSQKETPENVGDLRHDKLHQCIYYKEELLSLSKKEYQLLLLLMGYLNETVTKELIVEELWSLRESGSEGAIRVYINRLKQLLPKMRIENIRGIGYKLVQ